VLVEAIVTVGAVSGSREGLAFRHTSEVVFVEVFAFQSFLTQALEKMLAN
jgi:hypothetical protein